MTIRDIVKLASASSNLPQYSESEMSKKIEEIVNSNNLKSIQDATLKAYEKEAEKYRHVMSDEEIESMRYSAKKAGNYIWDIIGDLNKTSKYVNEQMKKIDEEVKKLKEEMPELNISDSFLNKPDKDLREYFSLFQDIAKKLDI